MEHPLALPTNVEEALGEFLGCARGALGEDLRSAVLFGSAAENRLRATPDVNLILVVAAFDLARLDLLRDPPSRGSIRMVRFLAAFVALFYVLWLIHLLSHLAVSALARAPLERAQIGLWPAIRLWRFRGAVQDRASSNLL